MGHAKTGYYSQQPFYSPPALGDVMDPPELVTEEDWSIAEAIEGCVTEIRQYNCTYAVCLEIWEGAYAGAPCSRKARCEDKGVAYDACKKAAGRCKKEIEHKMYGGSG